MPGLFHLIKLINYHLVKTHSMWCAPLKKKRAMSNIVFKLNFSIVLLLFPNPNPTPNLLFQNPESYLNLIWWQTWTWEKKSVNKEHVSCQSEEHHLCSWICAHWSKWKSAQCCLRAHKCLCMLPQYICFTWACNSNCMCLSLSSTSFKILIYALQKWRVLIVTGKRVLYNKYC